jgi:hypothetical protein
VDEFDDLGASIVAFCAVACLLGAALWAWADKKFDPFVEVRPST